jgi:hypothetical protein
VDHGFFLLLYDAGVLLSFWVLHIKHDPFSARFNKNPNKRGLSERAR